ncbi:hypothetical protein VW29_06735 [Devosia limi DSM 17137]|uniref:diguanylate cyclase n=1 Tax=Devosia limi DSM 17137 TaxID=1121477 RepID=A0A0F5LS91_9HYPH|nr:diguanylate cyclase [Devosia limi]KKB85245.1 hypothetical protein VW29_06735 [Devosia limi DSM 17137]SHF87219.1 diguanylate cyclase [Devosia limi DSM 17137]
MIDTDIFLVLVNGIGLMGLVAIAFGIVERLSWPRQLRSACQGLIFGAGAMLAMLSPAEMPNGVLIDMRAIIVAFAAAFGGWPAAVFAGVLAALFRLWIGGAGATLGAFGIVVAAGLGLAWRRWLRPKGRLKAQHLTVLGVVASLYLLVGFVQGMSGWTLVLIVAPYILVASVFASVVLGLFLDRELNQIAREEHWKTRALTDPLTALPNRRAFERGMALLRLTRNEAALLIIDLDHFKDINDTHGHAAGDYVLQRVALALRTHVRQRDLVARLGGEEMAVLLPDTNLARARQIAGRLRRAVENLQIEWDGPVIGVTASIGVAVNRGDVPAVQMFARADGALYAAKRDGRNRVSVAEEMRDVTPIGPLPVSARPRGAPRVA